MKQTSPVSGGIYAGLLVFMCIMACVLSLARVLQSQTRIREAVLACARGDFPRAAAVFSKLPSDSRDNEVMFWRGYMHYKGLGGFSKNRERALRLWGMAAAAGHKKALRAIKTLKDGGDFEINKPRWVSDDKFDQGLEAFSLGRYEEAFTLWMPLAENGHREAQSRLGVLYFEGKGVERNEELARLWWGAAAGTVDPHQIRDAYRTRDNWENAPREPEEALRMDDGFMEDDSGSEAMPEPAAAEKESKPAEKRATLSPFAPKKDSGADDEEEGDSGSSPVGRTATLGGLSQTGRQQEMAHTRSAKDNASDYKPWIERN